jgi:hypothetical protein
MAETPSNHRMLFSAYGLASLACVAFGCWIAAGHGVAASVWARNPGVWVLGVGMAMVVTASAGARVTAGFLLATPLVLGLTLLAPGLSGVHRWLQLGPVQVNAAALVLPPFVVALAAAGRGPLWPWLVGALVGVVLVVQPDASQGMALASAAIVILVLSPVGPARRSVGVVIALGLIAFAWARQDPLAPVAEVEGILRLAWDQSPFVAVLAASTLAAACLAPLLAAERGAALSTYFLMAAIAPALGACPGPLVGMGVSPILGAWLGVGLLATVGSAPERRAPSTPP